MSTLTTANFEPTSNSASTTPVVSTTVTLRKSSKADITGVDSRTWTYDREEDYDEPSGHLPTAGHRTSQSDRAHSSRDDVDESVATGCASNNADDERQRNTSATFPLRNAPASSITDAFPVTERHRTRNCSIPHHRSGSSHPSLRADDETERNERLTNDVTTRISSTTRTNGVMSTAEQSSWRFAVNGGGTLGGQLAREERSAEKRIGRKHSKDTTWKKVVGLREFAEFDRYIDAIPRKKQKKVFLWLYKHYFRYSSAVRMLRDPSTVDVGKRSLDADYDVDDNVEEDASEETEADIEQYFVDRSRDVEEDEDRSERLAAEAALFDRQFATALVRSERFQDDDYDDKDDKDVEQQRNLFDNRRQFDADEFGYAVRDVNDLKSVLSERSKGKRYVGDQVSRRQPTSHLAIAEALVSSVVSSGGNQNSLVASDSQQQQSDKQQSQPEDKLVQLITLITEQQGLVGRQMSRDIRSQSTDGGDVFLSFRQYLLQRQRV